MTVKKSIIVVGSGLSGLTAARELQGHEVIVLDKGYGIGGRLASRRLKTDGKTLGFFDYGTQYFSAQTPAFQHWVESLIEDHIVTTWGQGFQDSRGSHSSSLAPYYRGIKSNRAIAAHLSQGLTVINQTRVSQLQWNHDWKVQTTDGRSFQADAIVLTPPVPQTLELIQQSGWTLPDVLQRQLAQVTYAPCFALMAVFEHPCRLPAPGGLLVRDSSVKWIASNHMKGISPEGYGITILANEVFTQSYWDGDSNWIVSEMLSAAKPWLGQNQNAIATRLHRWKYSYPTTFFGQRSALIEVPGPLVFAGDAFCKDTITETSLHLEQAYLSGYDAAQVLKASESFNK